jgi:hypothetical protein
MFHVKKNMFHATDIFTGEIFDRLNVRDIPYTNRPNMEEINNEINYSYL